MIAQVVGQVDAAAPESAPETTPTLPIDDAARALRLRKLRLATADPSVV